MRCLALAAIVAALSIPLPQPAGDLAARRDYILGVLLSQNGTWPERAIAERQAAAAQEEELREKMNGFARAWNALVAERFERGSWNVKKHAAVLAAWKELEGTAGWRTPK